ncbi:hypothetical protein KUTeg_015081 [Tegillarca granosa]|uniref:Uncharacterized protein n=1 Tax=Tegillarca granosa TaxID=220873 RepID=A0ABQ9EP32_TEGGR|nr:hypothetical protein KUTeg_015081 [Tegillarca granosa]
MDNMYSQFVIRNIYINLRQHINIFGVTIANVYHTYKHFHNNLEWLKPNKQTKKKTRTGFCCEDWLDFNTQCFKISNDRKHWYDAELLYLESFNLLGSFTPGKQVLATLNTSF